MTLVYRSPLALVFEGRAEDILPTFAKAWIDCVVTDPPYGQSYSSGARYMTDRIPEMSGDDGSLDVAATLTLSLRSLKHGKHLYAFGPDLNLPMTEPVELVWAKSYLGQGDLTLPWAKAHERIGFYVHRSGKHRAMGKGRLAARLRQGSVLSVPRLVYNVNSRHHPTEKPVALMRMLIESSTLIGDVVLDPFAGSGSTAVAAIASGRRAIAIEIDPAYCQTIVNRVKEAEGLAQEIARL